MAETILVVDDEPAIVELISFNLRKAGYCVLTARTGEEALQVVETQEPDLILLDVMLPGSDGFTICQQIRRQRTTPVILLTAKNSEADKVWGLDSGADDYITKPFSPRELVARVRAILRRVAPAREAARRLEARGLVVDAERRQVTLQGQPVNLTPKEFDLLYLLMAGRGRVLTRDELLQLVWGYEYTGGTRTVDVHVRRLRQKLGDDPAAPRFIETLHGVGYRWKDETGS